MKRNKKFALVPIAAAVMAFGAAGPAAAATFDYDFGTLWNGSGPATPVTFAHLSVTTADYKTFNFDLKTYSNLDTVFGSAPGKTFVSQVWTNMASHVSTTNTGNVIVGGSWGVAQVRQDNSDPTPNNTISWDFRDSLCGTGNACNPNSPGARLTAAEEVKWVAYFASAQNPAFGEPAFSLKVQGYGTSGDYSSDTPISPIPEPETYAMLLAGLGLMGFVARRRKSRGLQG